MSEEIEVEVIEDVPTHDAEITVPDIEPKDVIASKEDIDKNTDAVRELTKIVKELIEENRKWFRAGKM